MEKIIISKSDSVAAVARKVKLLPDEDVTVVVPKQSELKTSIGNFRALKREAEKVGKRVCIESVDEEALALADKAGLEAVHPFLGAERHNQQERQGQRRLLLSDIVPRVKGGKDGKAQDGSALKEKAAAERTPKVHVAHSHAPRSADEGTCRPEETRRPEESKNKKGEMKRQPRPWQRFAALLCAACIIAGFGVWEAGKTFGGATVTVRLKQVPWAYSNTVTADASYAKLDAARRVLPAELFTVEKNTTQFFPATGAKAVQESARGRIVIYNVYSSAAQPLVVRTRFMTPDGKVFRITNAVVVPGADVKGGNITPASIEATVVADKPGEEYNLPPVAHLTVPGFQGTPRYKGFYASLPEGTQGGLMGDKGVPTSQDIEKGKARTIEILKFAAQNTFDMGCPPGLVVPQGATSFTVLGISANNNTDQSGNFSVFGKAVFKALSFRESDLHELMLLDGRSAASDDSLAFRELDIKERDVAADFANRRLSFSLEASGTLAPPFSVNQFKSNIAGLSIPEAQSRIGSVGGLVGGKISIWPFWMKRIPSSVGRINVVIE